MSLTTLDARTALVAIDLQAGITGMPTQPYPAADVVSRTAELADAFRSRGLPVVLVRVSFAPDWADAVSGRTEQQARGLAFPEGWDVIVDELSGHPGDIRVTKHNWSAFHGTDLDVQLRRRGITQIVLTGISTSIGVESTARDAYAHGYHVTLATDAMADSDPEAHAGSVERIFPRLGESGTTADVLELLSKTHA
ncbi:hydrolase [Streptomyces sp. NPDC007971]|uniref:hydrolase n=1 Tax=Streptomyces sp. NPDC007971 TaxID=3364799 RepID=UPI0036EB5133